MPVDVEVIKSAFDDFESENFIDAKEKISGQIKSAKNEFLRNKLGLSDNKVSDTKVDDTVVDDNKDDDTKVDDKKKRKSLKRK